MRTPPTLHKFLSNKGYTSIKLRLTSVGHLELKVRIKDKEVLFLLDTGAGSTVIDIEFARENDLKPTEASFKGGGVGTSELAVFQLELNELNLHGFIVNDMPVYAVDFTHIVASLKAKGETKLPAGVIGADILKQHKAVIDYAGNKLYLKRSILC